MSRRSLAIRVLPRMSGARGGRRRPFRRLLRVEHLEVRCLMAADLSYSNEYDPNQILIELAETANPAQVVSEGLLTADLPLSLAESITAMSNAELTYHPVIIAGVPTTDPTTTDSPDKRVTDLFPGVGSLYMTKGGPSGYICTGTLISTEHVLTAGHCLDSNNDGSADFKPTNVTFRTIKKDLSGNYVYDQQRTGAALFVNPNFSGFNGFNVNDDIAIIKLSSPITNSVVYSRGTVGAREEITLVGFGQSGTGATGYTVSPSLAIKRIGYNVVNPDFGGQDDAGQSLVDEVFYADFDGPIGNGTDGLPTLGNNRETTLGGGDSGGPSFNSVGKIVGVNTFTISNKTASAPYFGSEFGGILLSSYESWIALVLSGGGGSGGGSGGGKGGGKPQSERISYLFFDATPFITLKIASSASDPSDETRTQNSLAKQLPDNGVTLCLAEEEGWPSLSPNVFSTNATSFSTRATDEDATDFDYERSKMFDQLLELLAFDR